jgi:hypothetical protein
MHRPAQDDAAYVGRQRLAVPANGAQIIGDGEGRRPEIRGAGRDGELDDQRSERPHDPGTPDQDAIIAALGQEVHGLRQRQLTQAVIEQAKGMLMGYYGITADMAFTVLTRWSQESNTKLRDIAAALVAAGGQPSTEPFGALRTALDDLAVTGATDNQVAPPYS